MEKLHLEPIREPTPSISISGSSGPDKSKFKSGRESPEGSKQSESDHNKSEGSVRYTAQSKENPEQQVLLPTQVTFGVIETLLKITYDLGGNFWTSIYHWKDILELYPSD